MVAIGVQAKAGARADIDECQWASWRGVLDDAERQGGLHATPDLVHLVPVVEPAPHLVRVIEDQATEGGREAGVDGLLVGAGEVGPQRVVGMVVQDPLDAGRDEERRDPIRRDLAGQSQDLLVGGDDVEQRGGQRPARVGVRAGPPPGDLCGLIADGGCGGGAFDGVERYVAAPAERKRCGVRLADP